MVGGHTRWLGFQMEITGGRVRPGTVKLRLVVEMTKHERRVKRLLALSGQEALSATELKQQLVGLSLEEGSRLAALSSFRLAERTPGWSGEPAYRDRIWVTTTAPGGVITSAQFEVQPKST